MGKVNKETGGGRSGLRLISGTMWWIKACVFNTIVCLCVGFLPHKVSASDIFLVIDLFVYKNEVCITRFLVWVFRHEKTGFQYTVSRLNVFRGRPFASHFECTTMATNFSNSSRDKESTLSLNNTSRRQRK